MVELIPNPDVMGWLGSDAIQQSLAASLPTLSQAAPHLLVGEPQQVLLYLTWKHVFGDYPKYPAQVIGDCTGFGNSHMLDLDQTAEVYLGDLPVSDVHETCTEFTYAAGREAAGILGHSDGGYGAAVVKAISTVFGTLPRGAVGAYSGQRAKDWGYSGAPADMKKIAANYKTGPSAQITTTDEAVATLNAGKAFSICTAHGFTMTRDSDGFCSMKGRWGHCMCVAGYRTDKPGFLVLQSWGMDQPAGPLALGQPPFSFWVTPQDLQVILDEGDSWAVAGTKGFPQIKSLPAELRRAS